MKLINEAIDLSFVSKLLEGSYNKYDGRPAKDPELMIRLLILQHLYNLSDVEVIERASLDLDFLWFLGLNPDENLPDPSLLSKFRAHRLKDITLDEIIVEIVRQCVEKEIIQDTGIRVDATHTEANTFNSIAERVMKHIAKKLFKTLENELGEIPKGTDQDIPNYKEIEDHREAKKVMKEYVEKEIDKVCKITNKEEHPETRIIIEKAKQIMNDPKFLEQKGVPSLVDQDARVGHKSKIDRFFGYKTEFTMTTEERMITAVNVENGAYVDVQNLIS